MQVSNLKECQVVFLQDYGMLVTIRQLRQRGKALPVKQADDIEVAVLFTMGEACL